MHKNGYWIVVGTLMFAGGCLGPNPLLEECGQTWAIDASEAIGFDDTGAAKQIKSGKYPIVAKQCLSEAQVALLSDPASDVYELLRLQALTDCENLADAMGLINNTCEESLSDPYYVSTCLLDDDECNPAGDTGETGGTEETGDTGGFTDPIIHVDCKDDVCAVDQSLIDEVLLASPSTFAADGTTLAPHFTTGGVQDGWEFGGITAGSLGDALRFANGDVVTEVGGAPVDSWAAVIDVANAALHADEVTVRYIRDGRVLSRTFQRR